MGTLKKLNPILRQKQADRKQKAAEYAAYAGSNFAGIIAEIASQTAAAIHRDPTKTGLEKDILLRRLDAQIVKSLSALESLQELKKTSEPSSDPQSPSEV